MNALEAEGLNTFYGKSHILFDVGLKIEEGRITTLLGRNGAGKTTTLKTLMGVIAPRSGSIRLGGQAIGGHKPHEIAALGMQLVPEERRIFG
ncbi:MAG: ATP-binding cassette domain-containing protein, partial [Acetobacteraceae bacterium]